MWLAGTTVNSGMVRMNVRGRQKARFMKVHAILGGALLTVSTFNLAYGSSAAKSALVGEWAWNDEYLPAGTFKKSFRESGGYTLKFGSGGNVEAMVSMRNGLGPRVGEALAANGRYQVKGRRLVMTTDPRPSDGWPGRDGKLRSRYVCRLTLAPKAASFRLDGCPIHGNWFRVDGE